MPSLVDRNTSRKLSLAVDSLSGRTLTPILAETTDREAHVMTDEAGQDGKLSASFAKHDYVRHGAGESMNLENALIHTNMITGAFSVFKRGMKGVYQHCGKQHLHRYLAEFDFRYNNRLRLGLSDPERTRRAVSGIKGRRLMYRDSLEEARSGDR